MLLLGEKATLVCRLVLHDKCVEKNIKSGDVYVSQLKMGDLKKVAAKEGVSPIGSQDEILNELVGLLYNKAAKVDNNDKSASTKGEKGAGGGGGGSNVIDLAKKVLSLGEVDDDEGILNLGTVTGSPPITKSTPSNIMRKAYLKLSLLLHPDKLGSIYDGATKVFQALVRAFERLSSPDLINEAQAAGGKTGKGANKTISRSNEGCHRTRILCPRCRQPWSEGSLDGNPDYFYNFIMQGLKQMNCSTCLCTFGCMTAIHKCPACKKTFEYNPADYHRKISCGNGHCSKVFGFYLFPASEKVMNDLKIEIKELQEKGIKEREAKARRAGSLFL